MIFWTMFLPLTALGFTLYFHLIDNIFKGKKRKFRIDSGVSLKPVSRELILFGTSSTILFIGFGLLTGWIVESNYGLVFSDRPENWYQLIYMVASFFIAFVIHDVYFYWIHRLLHTQFMFRFVHSWHHRSHDTNAWSAFSFHPVEGLFQIGIIPLMTFIFPVHEYALIVYTILLMLISVYGHCGYELRVNKPASFDVFNSSLHHFQHHRYVHYNYSIYLNVWDKLFGTEYPGYGPELDKIRERMDRGDLAG